MKGVGVRGLNVVVTINVSSSYIVDGYDDDDDDDCSGGSRLRLYGVLAERLLQIGRQRAL